MTEIAKYKPVPITSIFGKKIKDPKGMNEKTMNTAFYLGLLSEEEVMVLKAFRSGDKPEISNGRLPSILDSLRSKRLISLK